MTELIKIRKSPRTGNPVVDARELYRFLGAKQDFSNWFKGRISKYEFVENKEFATLFYDKNGDRIQLAKNSELTTTDTQRIYRIEYAITLDCAKELAMVQHNKKGKQARRYFIEKEKEFWVLKEGLESKKNVTFNMSETAMKLNLNDYCGSIGRNGLYKILKHNGVVDKKNQPIEKYVKMGYFLTKPTMITETGFKWLNQMFRIETDNVVDLDEFRTDIILSLKGISALSETILFNKGGRVSEEQNRMVTHRLRSSFENINERLNFLETNQKSLE